jgi:hypothetical protein
MAVLDTLDVVGIGGNVRPAAKWCFLVPSAVSNDHGSQQTSNQDWFTECIIW